MIAGLALASIGLQFGGNLLQAGENYKAAKEEARALEFQADNAEKEGRHMFKVIKKQGESVLGAADVQLATSGFRMDTAQALEIKDEIIKNVNHDAMNAVLSGTLQARSLRDQARKIRSAAKKGRGLSGIVSGAAAAVGLYGASK